MKRRTFIAASALSLAWPAWNLAAESEPLRVGVIGHTGRGNYGHGIDTVWLQVPQAKIVAVADADPAGLAAAQKRLQVEAGFADYRELLKQAKPELVAVCSRQPDQHRDMIVAAAEAGAKGIYVEKPFCRTPQEADEIIAACEQAKVKLAVAHRNRYHPSLRTIDQMLADGKLGKILEIRGRGKGDARGGSEDLWVLGSHVLNMICYFAGTPQTCSAVVLQDGRRVTTADVHPGNEALGPLAGNEVHARYLMSQGITAYFDSIANDGTKSRGFGLQIIGSEGVIDLKMDANPLAHWIEGNAFEPSAGGRRWQPLNQDEHIPAEEYPAYLEQVAHHVVAVKDLLAAISEDRQPQCSMYEAATTVEMISGVFESHRQGSKAVPLPLAERDHPLSKL